MKQHSFFDDILAVSLMYDAILFLVMVSLAGVILLPVLRNNIATESSVEKHREQVVDETLHAFLLSRADFFDYKFCGTLLDDAAGKIGIDNSSDGIYGSLSHWLLGHEQCHKTYATLLAEDLGCQFRVPFSFIGTNQLNIFTGDFDRQLRNETKRFFSSALGEKYRYNVSAWWHPIKGVPFGGEFSVGEHPPIKDCFVARSFFMMPYAPVLCIGNYTVIFTKYWLKNQLFSQDVGFGRSLIPAISNMTIIFENYTNRHSPYDTRENATRGIIQNLSTLVYGFFIDGITNETNVTVFPGIVHMTLTYGFEKIRNITKGLLNDVLNESFGQAIRTIDRLFCSLNASTNNPLSQMILNQLNMTIQGMLNASCGSLDETFDTCEKILKEKITVLVKNFLYSSIETFVNLLFDGIDTIRNFSEMLIDWLFDHISLNKAEVVLTIWTVREE